MAGKKALVVCGPTGGGKSDLSDAFAEALSLEHGAFVPTLVVDSMQVYREIPVITNQARRRPAELVGIVPVTEEWTVARHKERAEEIISETEGPFVLDAGTGMYLNAIILDVPLAPKVEPGTRRLAETLTTGAPNPRRAAREKELELSGAPKRRSIWDGDPRYDVALIYLRPDTHTLDAAIQKRSDRIVVEGPKEAELLADMLASGTGISAPVLDSIGVRELLEHVRGESTAPEAASRIATRTRQLARRQRRWFDKLARTLSGRVPTTVVEGPRDINTMLVNTMHDRIWA
jgi:tRNA dimethylallyltransferase